MFPTVLISLGAPLVIFVTIGGGTPRYFLKTVTTRRWLIFCIWWRVGGPHGIEIAAGGPTLLKSLVGAPTVLFKDFYDAPLAHFTHVLAYGCAPRC